MKKPLINQLINLLCLLNLNMSAQDIITKIDGSEIKAKVLEISTTEIKFKRFDYVDGPTVIIPISDLISIKYPNGNIVTFKKNNIETAKNSTSNISKLNRDTTLKTYYSTGELQSETPYVNGKINGIQKLYYKNGALISECPFVNDIANGLCKTYYKRDRKYWDSEFPFLNGMINGIVKFHYRTRGGVIVQLREVKFIENKGYYPSGELYMEIPNGNGIINGIVKYYRKDGKKLGEFTFVNNVLNGKGYDYDKNGNVRTMVDFSENENTNKPNVLGEVNQGLQQGIAYNNMLTNTNYQTVNDYTQIAINNYTKPQNEALNSNNTILQNSSQNNLNQKNVTNSESSASTNGGTTSGKDGNSPEAMECQKEAKKEFENSKEYHDFYDNRNDVTVPLLRYGELAKAKNIEIYLNHCSQYLSEQEKTALKSAMDNCRKTAAEMNGNTIQH